MTYKQAVEYVDSFINFEKIPRYEYAAAFRLERMSAFLRELGDPHETLKAFHVAGSKGKGSTCAIAAYILKEAGYRVGLYTSPHLVDFRERIRILGKVSGDRRKTSGSGSWFEGMISESEFVGLIERIRPAAEKFRDHVKFGRASFFEILTAAAFLHFKDKKVDFAVLETGLGGRLDATNTANPVACGITSISLEHTDKLGDTLAKIAFEKAGIIKTRGVIVSASQKREAGDVIRKACEERGAGLHEAGKDIKYRIVDSNERRQVFDTEGPGYSYKNLELNLIGYHQIENASMAIGMLKLAESGGFKLGEDAVRRGLKKAIWPGRLQIIRRRPRVILDGAQNPASISVLISSVNKLFKYNRFISVFGISSDKDIKGVSRLLDRASDKVILTRAKDNPRAQSPLVLKKYFSKADPFSGNVEEALKKALESSGKEDLILVTGSLFVVGDAIGYFKNSVS
ncbi:MAG: folylpolyglutamate synthase/dihydrofolate synthase family protein [Candidatus Omnitrophota bacterium]